MTEYLGKWWRLYNYKCDVSGDNILALSEVCDEAFEAGYKEGSDHASEDAEKLFEELIHRGHEAGRQSVIAEVMPVLEFYAAGHDHSHEYYLQADCDKIPVVKVVNLVAEIRSGKTGKQVYDEAMTQEFKYRSGKRARALRDKLTPSTRPENVSMKSGNEDT
jgi:hypothetical protein